MRVVVIRQRPSIGDCLLLEPLIREIKNRDSRAHVTVVTDPNYMGGSLVKIFEGIPGIDKIESIPSFDWTTEDNKATDPLLRSVHSETPLFIRKADAVYNCNTAFLAYEGGHGNDVAYGIAEFWTRHFDMWKPEIDLRPRYTISAEAEIGAQAWMTEHNPEGKPMVGIVLNAAHAARDWNFDNKAGTLADWVHTRGLLPISFDVYRKAASIYCKAVVGKQIDVVGGLLKKCAIVVTPDTGLLHLAEAVGTRTVSLWGILNPKLRVADYNTVIVPKQSHSFCASNDPHCQCPWKFQQYSCLRRLHIREIIAGIEEGLRL